MPDIEFCVPVTKLLSTLHVIRIVFDSIWILDAVLVVTTGNDVNHCPLQDPSVHHDFKQGLADYITDKNTNPDSMRIGKGATKVRNSRRLSVQKKKGRRVGAPKKVFVPTAKWSQHYPDKP